MPITILSPDGTSRFVFPDDTPPDAISAAMKKHFESQPPKAPDKPAPGLLETVGDVATSYGREFNRGISGAYEGLYRGMRGGLGLVGAEGIMRPYEETPLASGAAHMSRGEAQTTAGRYAGAVGSATAAALPAVGGLMAAAPRLAAMAPTTTIGGIGRDMGRSMVAAPGAAAGMDAASIAGAGLAQQGAADAGAGPMVQTLASMVGGFAPALRLPTAPPGPSPNARYGQDKVLEAIARDFPQVPPESAPAAFADRARLLTDRNPAARVADAGGENVRTLLRLSADRPNAARDGLHTTLDKRAERQWKRLEDGIVDIVAAPRVNPGLGATRHGVAPPNNPRHFFENAETLADEMHLIGWRDLEPTLATKTEITPRLAQVLNREHMAPVLERVRKSMNTAGRDPEGLSAFPDRKPVGETELLWRLKVELDDSITRARKAEKTGNATTADHISERDLIQLKNDLLGNIKNPPFRAALDKYASKAQLEEAMQAGRDEFKKLQPEEIKARIRDLKEPLKQQYYRIGLMRSALEDIARGNAPNDRLKSVFGSPEMRRKFAAALPDGGYMALMRKLAPERRMVKTREAVKGNSITNRLQMERQAAIEPVEDASMGVRTMVDALNLRFGDIAQNVPRMAKRAQSRLIPKESAEEIIKGLMSRDPEYFSRVGPTRAAASRASEPIDARTAIINALMAGTSGAR